MRRIFLILILVIFPVTSWAAWTFNTACTFTGNHDIADGTLVYIQCDLNSDGAAETAIDIWASFTDNASSTALQEKRILGTGGFLYAVEYKQGTAAPDNDFVLTAYDNGGYPIFSETIDFNEVGQGIVGGYYPGNKTESQYPPVGGGLTIDVADIGTSGDDIVLIFIFQVKPK